MFIIKTFFYPLQNFYDYLKHAMQNSFKHFQSWYTLYWRTLEVQKYRVSQKKWKKVTTLFAVWILVLIRVRPENWDQIGLKYHSAANRANREANILGIIAIFPFYGRFFAFNWRKILLFPNFLQKNSNTLLGQSLFGVYWVLKKVLSSPNDEVN